MKKKIVGIFVCMLVMTAAVVSAAEIMNIAAPSKIDKYVCTDTIEKEFKEKSLIKKEQDDGNPPQQLATKTDYFSIPAAAFIPEGSSMTYSGSGNLIGGEGEFYAPVYLPNEATVTKLLFFWSDYYGSDDGTASLLRYSFGAPSTNTMAEASTSGSTGSGASEDTSIDTAEIDNSQYSYFVALDFPSGNIKCYNVIIEYNYEPVSVPENMINCVDSQVSNMVSK